MKNYLIMGILSGLVYNVSASDIAAKKLSIPAKDLVVAAKEIVAQTGPVYMVSGVLKCNAISQQVPPYKMDSSCQIEISGGTREILNPEKIISAVQKIKPMNGPFYSFEGTFVASSMSSEFPPYGVTDYAEVVIK